MNKIDEVLTRGVTNVIPSPNQLKKVLSSGKKLNIYLGIDPTMTKIHLGHAVPLRKLQTFSEMGHNVTFLIGDFTALIGDTSDKDSERPILTEEEIEKNFRSYKKQAKKFLDFSKIKIHYNSEWLQKLSFAAAIKLVQNFSLGDFISRELIKKRLTDGKHVRLDETLYPVMQGYDSYFMNTDIQLGGADQTFNMQAGRLLQKKLRSKESFILVNDYLIGTDGRKMTKSWGNAVWVEDSPDDMFGKLMSISDKLVSNYYILATALSLNQIKEKINELKDQPLNLKKHLAFAVVSELHSKTAAQKALKNFEKTFQEKSPNFDLQIPLGSSLAETISPYTSLSSVSEAKRLIAQGAVTVDGHTLKDPTFHLKLGQKVQIGKRVFGTIVKK